MGYDANKLTSVYLKMRAAKAQLTRDYEIAKAKIEADMETVEGLLLGTLNHVGAKSLRTSAGTCYIEETIKPSCEDWGKYHGWIRETGAFEGLEKRVARNFVASYMKENKGEAPPGLLVFRENVVRVRVGNE